MIHSDFKLVREALESSNPGHFAKIQAARALERIKIAMETVRAENKLLASKVKPEP